MRGKQGQGRVEGADDRLIPACAGKTQTLHAPIWHARAHPRVCGENFVAFQAASSKMGSSPRVRGKPLAIATGIPASGLIPACAGKTALIWLLGRSSRAHPRVCGENRIT